MTTVGLELTTFIDPNLTWRTVSKGRNTSRRSRRPTSKNLKMGQDQGRNSCRRLSGAQSSDSDKSDVSLNGRGFSENMGHIPIKKRRFILRSPSPPLQSPNRLEVCQERVQCSDQFTFCNRTAEPQATRAGFSSGSVSEKSVSDGNVEQSLNFVDGAHVSVGDFSGTAILAATANSGSGDAGKTSNGDGSSCLHGKENALVEDSPVFSLTDSVKAADKTLENSGTRSDDTGKADCGGSSCLHGKQDVHVEEFPLVSPPTDSIKVSDKTLEKVGATSDDAGKTNDVSGSSCLLEKDDVHVEESHIVSATDSIKDADKTLEKSDATRDYRFPWDLNVVMDEWDDDPPFDAVVQSGMQGVDVTPTNGINSHNTDNINASESPERTVACGSGDKITAQTVSHGRTSAFNLLGHALEVSSDIVMSHLKDYNTPQNATGHAMETSSIVKAKEQHDMVRAHVEIDQSLSPGFKATKPSVLEQFYNTPASENGMNCENPQAAALEKSVVGCENKLGEGLTQSAQSLPCSSEIPAVDPKDSNVSHCSSNPENTIAVSASFENEQAVDIVVGKEVQEKPRSSEGCDHPIKNSNFYKPIVSEKPTSTSLNRLGDNNLENLSKDGGHNVLVLNAEPSQVTENTGNAAEVEGEYDCHLEDGELRESVGHCWEDNEGEYGETEHVDYDSDNREGIYLEADNDSNQLSGEVIIEQSGKQGDCLVNSSSADDQPDPDKTKEQLCSPRDQGVLSTLNATITEYTERRSPILKTCAGMHHKGEINSDMVEVEYRSDMEAGAGTQENENDALRNCGGASVSGRELQFSDRNGDSTRSSCPNRSNNFDSHLTDGLGEPSGKQYNSLQTDQFDGRCLNVEEKSTNAGYVSAEDKERTFRGSDDTSPRVCRPRIISTSRSGYHFIRRGSQGERDSDYGIGMAKSRGINPDCNSRSRFDRFSNGMNRNFREGYHRPDMYEGGKSSGSMLNQFGKRERSFSPVERVGTYFPRGYIKSRSRSRTRSPDSRSAPRMGRGRGRLQYQQATNHTSEHTRDRRSPVKVFNQRPRFNTMGSPSRIRSDDYMRPMVPPVRIFDAAKSGRDHEYEESPYHSRKPIFIRSNRRSRSRSRSCSPGFRRDARMGATRFPYQPSNHNRDRRSPPVRGFPPGQRYDIGGSPRRLSSDDSMTPIMRPARFTSDAQSVRGHDYNNGGDECRSKSQNIFERIHPVRRYNGDRDVRRFQYDEQDNLASQNFRRNENYSRAGDRRPVEVLRREERSSLRYNSNRMFYPGPKQ